MHLEIIVNVHTFEKRVAIIEDHKLVELFAEKKEQQLIVGNIYKGVVKNVLPGLGAAFIDIGFPRAAFLHYKDIEPSELSKQKKKIYEKNNSSDIGKILANGDEIVVQVTKDPIGKKGARVNAKLSLPGKFLVFKPNETKVMISRKITSNSDRRKIKKILKPLKDKKVGVIVRTDTHSIKEEDFKKEYNGLARTWKLIQKQMKHAKGPVCIFDENDLSFSLIRDLFSSKIDRLIIDNKKLKNQIVSNLKKVTPELVNRIELYDENTPIFDAFGIEKDIETIFYSRVSLPSGGNITIQQTEALVAIDVNTGSFTGDDDYHKTIELNNYEAALEVARQIRLRDLVGIMVIDFIDMTNEKSQKKVFSALKNALKNDRATNKIFPFSPLGLVEISRKRTRPSLLLSYSEQCPHCNGTGRLISRDSVAIRISRWLLRANFFIKNEPLKIVVHKNVKTFIEENESILENIGSSIKIEGNSNIKVDEFRIYSQKTNEEITNRYNT